jgi:hypothetical protein
MTNPSVAFLKDFAELKIKYESGVPSLDQFGEFGVSCLKLLRGITLIHQGSTKLQGVIKDYLAYEIDGVRSRPIRSDLYISDPGNFEKEWTRFTKMTDDSDLDTACKLANSVIYTLIQSFSSLIDIYKPGSRKTPGTLFEMIVGVILVNVSGLKMSKQIPVPGERYMVPTDIVLLQPPGVLKPNLVIPTKITTRERIVQPFAHQRILDEVFGPEKYKSILVMVSELQRDDEGQKGLNEICVPNQIGMYQKYLGHLSGMYYLDVPNAYAISEFSKTIPVRTFGELLYKDLTDLLGQGSSSS